MFSSLPDRVRRNFSLRLTLWYAAVLLFAILALFALAYQSLSSALEKEDRRVLESKMGDYAGAYQKGDLADLEEFVNAEREFGKPVLFFVRMASPENRTLLLSLPDAWSGADLAQMQALSIHETFQRFSLAGKDGEMVFEIFSMPMLDRNVLQVGKAIGLREEFLARFRRVFAGVMVPAVLIGLVGGYVLTFRALRPIRRLTHTVRSIIDTGKTEARVPRGGTEDELNGLVVLFNRMLERIGDLVQGMREALDHVAHDLRTPMTRLRATAEMALQPGQNRADSREALAVCLEESERIVKMLDAIMDIAEAEAGTLKLNREQTDLGELIRDVADLYRFVAEEKNIDIRTAPAGDLRVCADPHRIRQVVANLLDNAVKYTPAGGIVEIEAHPEVNQVRMTVKDTGMGIRREELSRIWDRLYRGDESRSQRGLGLGLSVVKSIVEIHGGRIDVSSSPGAGSTFTVTLPRNS